MEINDNIGYYYSLGLSRAFEKFDLSLAYSDFSHEEDASADEQSVFLGVNFEF